MPKAGRLPQDLLDTNFYPLSVLCTSSLWVPPLPLLVSVEFSNTRNIRFPFCSGSICEAMKDFRQNSSCCFSAQLDAQWSKFQHKWQNLKIKNIFIEVNVSKRRNSFYLKSVKLWLIGPMQHWHDFVQWKDKITILKR